MAEEVEEEEGKKGGGLVLIIAIVLGVLLVIGITIGATLFLAGFFDPPPEETAQEQIDKAQAEADQALGAEEETPDKKLEAPDIPKFETTYYELERDMLANVQNSRKMMQIKIAIMTNYDEKVISNIEDHIFAIRSAIMDLMRQKEEEDIIDPEFRKTFAEEVRLEMNDILEQYEGFGGIEKVYFSDFIIQ